MVDRYSTNRNGIKRHQAEGFVIPICAWSTVLAPPTAAVVLGWLAPIPGLVTAVGHDTHGGGSPDAAVVHLVALAAWLLVGWLLLATVTTLLARLPGGVGRATDVVSRRVTPALIRRAISGSAALGIAVSPALAPAAATAGACAPGRLPGLDRTATACAPDVSGDRRPSGPTHPAPASGATATGTPAAATPVEGHTHTVVAGDTLWGLAAAELDAAGRPTTPDRVAERWPAWWQANRVVIGNDPDLIRVGTVLAAPDPLEKSP